MTDDVIVNRADLEAALALLIVEGYDEDDWFARLAAALVPVTAGDEAVNHDPWDFRCSKNIHGEPTRGGARCPICSPASPAPVGEAALCESCGHTAHLRAACLAVATCMCVDGPGLAAPVGEAQEALFARVRAEAFESARAVIEDRGYTLVPAPTSDGLRDDREAQDARGRFDQPSDTGWWTHTTDGSRCGVFLANRVDVDGHDRWWCTEHQSHLEWAEPAQPTSDGLRDDREALVQRMAVAINDERFGKGEWLGVPDGKMLAQARAALAVVLADITGPDFEAFLRGVSADPNTRPLAVRVTEWLQR